MTGHKIHDCPVCWRVFDTNEKLITHMEKHPKLGTCPICKKIRLLERHHWSYEDYEKDKKANTMRICNECHGHQTNVQKLIHAGTPVIYIGHIIKQVKYTMLDIAYVVY